MPEDPVTRDAARAAKKKATAQLVGCAEVVGVGLTRVGAGYGVKVNLRAPLAAGLSLPDAIDGVPIRVEIVGGVTPR